MSHPKNRIFVNDSVLSSAVALTVESLKRRTEKHGVFSYIGPHEALGIITEEYQELIAAVHGNNRVQTKAELIDIAVACIFALASLNQQDIDGAQGDESNLTDPDSPDNPSLKMVMEQMDKDYAKYFGTGK